MVLPACEGVIIKLKGGSSEDHPDGLPCSTDTLNHPDTIDFGDGGIATFGGRIGGTGDSEDDVRTMLRDCFQVSSATISSFFRCVAFFSGSPQWSSAGGQFGVGRRARMATFGRLHRLAGQPESPGQSGQSGQLGCRRRLGKSGQLGRCRRLERSGQL